MNINDFPIVGPAVDMEQVPAINYKRTLAFMNHFVTHTVRFLNKFSGVCEQKLSDLQFRMQKMEITLSLLESKLSSIPGMDEITAPNNTPPATNTTSDAPQTTNTPSEAPPSQHPATVAGNTQQDVTEETPAAAEQVPAMTVSKDPRYMKFFKMINFGVPIKAVKAKVGQEGLNPDLLDTPDAPAPEGEVTANSEGDSSDDTTSSFSSDEE